MKDNALYDDPLQVYLHQISRVPVLDSAAEIRCIEHVRASDQIAESARTRLIEAHLQHVVSVAQLYQTDRTNMLDLIEQGNKGLLRAVDSLSDDAHDCFWSYARAFVERAVAQAASTVAACPSP